MSYCPTVDKDEEHAKKCLDCGKNFYVGEECPFCVVVIMHCEKCEKAKADVNNSKWTNRLRAIKDALDQKPKKIKHVNTKCDDCKTNELCASPPPFIICNER